MHAWVLEKFTRDDEYCEHNSNIVAIYHQSAYREARKHYTKLCNDNIIYDRRRCNIHRWNYSGKFCFSASYEDHNGFKENRVTLTRKEIKGC